MCNKARNYSMVEYYNRKAKNFEPRYRFKGTNPKEFELWKQQLLTELKQALGPMPKPVPLNPEITEEIIEDGLVKHRVILNFEEFMSAPALVYIPESALNKPAPAILCNHGHGDYGKDSVMGIRSSSNLQRSAEIESMNFDYGLQMAKHGYVTMAIDWRGFGERNDRGHTYPSRDQCNVHFIRGSLMGINLLALDLFDGLRCIDYLYELDCVDSNRIGTMGLSLGGTMTTWIAMMDDRVKAADVICYSCRFKNFAVGDANFCGSQFMPGLFGLCDVPDLHGLIAPKPLLAEIGVYDECFNIDEALDCSREVAKIYKAAEVPENYEVDLFEGSHSFAGNKAFGFFDKHLKNAQKPD